MAEGRVLGSGEGREVNLRGTIVGFKATGQRSAAGPTVLELVTAPGFNTGAHVHSKIEELMYVVEGEFEFRLGDRMLNCGPGSFVEVPPGVAHALGNSGSEPATLVCIISPGGVHDRYFEELAELLAKEGAPDPQAIGELRRRYDTEQVSPLAAR